MGIGQWTKDPQPPSCQGACFPLTHAHISSLHGSHHIQLCHDSGRNHDLACSHGVLCSYPGVVSVASVDCHRNVSWFSTYNANVTVTAPGSDVLSTVPLDFGAPKVAHGFQLTVTSAEHGTLTFTDVNATLVDGSNSTASLTEAEVHFCGYYNCTGDRCHQHRACSNRTATFGWVCRTFGLWLPG